MHTSSNTSGFDFVTSFGGAPPATDRSEPCLWMETPLGEYAVYSPHKRFSVLWEISLSRLVENGVPPDFQRIPPDGPKPDWCGEQVEWPLASAAERPASRSAESLPTPSLGDTKRKRLGSDSTEAIERPPYKERRKAEAKAKAKGRSHAPVEARTNRIRPTSQEARRDWNVQGDAVPSRPKPSRATV